MVAVDRLDGHGADGVLVLDYLVIGHVTRDLGTAADGLGGTAAYAARTALALGCRTGIVTSAPADLDLEERLKHAEVARRTASTPTTFENIYQQAGRHQILRSVAKSLGPEAVPEDWQASLVHIGPVARECDPSLSTRFPGAFVGVTPQGWMRQWDRCGHVRRRLWKEAEQILPHADAVVLSDEDVAEDRSLVLDYARQTRCLVLTQGAEGCTIYAAGEVSHLPAPAVEEVDPTGAGDVFAACLFFAMQRGHPPQAAARFACCCAALSVTRPGLLGAPLPDEIVHCRQAVLRG